MIKKISVTVVFICIFGVKAWAAECIDLNTTLKQGARGGPVSSLQRFLIDQKVLGSIPTGYFGTKTFVAVKYFQSQNDILQTGIAGPITRGAIKNKSCNVGNDLKTNSTTTQTKLMPPLNKSITNPTNVDPLSGLKSALKSLGIETNFATTTMSEAQILEMTRKFEQENIIGR